MKTCRIAFIAIGLACLMAACTSSRQKEMEGLKTVRIEVDNVRNDVALSEFAEATFIPLPTADDLIIGNIKRIRTSDKYIFLNDKNALYRFSRSGDFCGKIQKKGPGPDEYTSIIDFVITENDEIAVLSTWEKSLLFYSWDGQMTKEVKLDVNPVSHIIRLEDKLLVNNGNYITSSHRHVLSAFDYYTGERIQNLLPVDEQKAKFLHNVESNTFTLGENDTTCYFYSWFNDTIYRVTPAACQPAIALDFAGRNISASHYRQDFPDVLTFLESLPAGKPYGTSFYMQSDNYLLVKYMQRQEPGGAAVVSLKDGEQINMEEVRIDELEGFPIEMAKHGWDDNHFVTGMNESVFILQPMEILDYIEEYVPEAMDDVKKKIKYSSDDQNPVLMIVKLK